MWRRIAFIAPFQITFHLEHVIQIKLRLIYCEVLYLDGIVFVDRYRPIPICSLVFNRIKNNTVYPVENIVIKNECLSFVDAISLFDIITFFPGCNFFMLPSNIVIGDNTIFSLIIHIDFDTIKAFEILFIIIVLHIISL